MKKKYANTLDGYWQTSLTIESITYTMFLDIDSTQIPLDRDFTIRTRLFNNQDPQNPIDFRLRVTWVGDHICTTNYQLSQGFLIRNEDKLIVVRSISENFVMTNIISQFQSRI
jgi:hypothetical protein